MYAIRSYYVLCAVKHHGCQRNVAADNNVVLIGDIFCCHDIHVFIDRNRIGIRFAHYLDVLCGIAADKESYNFV